MFDGLMIGLLVVILGNLMWLERKVAKMSNELKHIKERIERIPKVMEVHRR